MLKNALKVLKTVPDSDVTRLLGLGGFSTELVTWAERRTSPHLFVVEANGETVPRIAQLTASDALVLVAPQHAGRWVARNTPATLLGHVVTPFSQAQLVATVTIAVARFQACVPLDELTWKEREVLDHLLLFRRPPTIAKLLGRSPHTIRNRLKATYAKLDVGCQAELVDRVLGRLAPRRA